MKYFTPDLLARFGSPDEKVANAASEEWERAHQAYLGHLRAIRPQLTRRVRHFLDRFSLHDARVLTGGVNVDEHFFFLELGLPGGRGIRLTYRLADRPKLVQHRELAESGVPLEWQYDELDVETEKPFPVFRHSILLTDGWELRLSFYDLSYSTYRTLSLTSADFAQEQSTANG